MSRVGIGIIGLGNVGRGTLQVLSENAETLQARLGFPLEVTALCSRSVSSDPPPEADRFPSAIRTTDWRGVVGREDVHIVAELVGGTSVASEIVQASIDAGKAVVTANKELMAESGGEIWRRAQAAGTGLAMEASVAGGIPILTALREGINSDRVEKLLGILNGTCNYILTEMERRGEALDSILAEAQRLGYAEADPSADIDGYDARSKLVILCALAFGFDVEPTAVDMGGIRRIAPIDFAYANRLGHTIRLIAAAEYADDRLILSVRPSLIRQEAVLASVRGSYNAVWVQGRHGEDTFYYGRGAGGKPTGVAVVSDLIRLARDLKSGAKNRVSPFSYERPQPREPDSVLQKVQRHYLRFRVQDRPGILAELSAILARAGISIDAVLQEPSQHPEDLPFVITLEPTPGAAVETALKGMKELPFMVESPLALPIERT